MKKDMLASLLLLMALLLTSSFLEAAMAQDAIAGMCDSECNDRCAEAGVKDRCMTYCGICCRECKCVPSGTYGNKDECPCYRDKKNSKGTSKCP